MAQMVKNLPAMQETQGQSWVGKTHSSILAWRIPCDRGARQATVHGVAKFTTEKLSLWGLKECCGSFGLLSRPLRHSPCQQQGCFTFSLLMCPWVALLISFRNFSSAFTTWLTVRCQRPTFQPVSALHMPFSLSLIISSLVFKLTDMWLFLLLEHLEVIVGLSLIIGLISILQFREQGGLRRGREVEGQSIGEAARIHTH